MKLVLTIFLSLCFSILSAQTEKGGVIISSRSNISMVFAKNTITEDNSIMEVTETKSLSIAPSYGKLISDNLALGITLFVEYQKDIYKDQISVNFFQDEDLIHQKTRFGFAPYLRGYLPTTENFKPYLEIDAGYNFLDLKIDDNMDNFEGYFWDVGIGFSAFISKRIAIDTQVTFSKNKLIFTANDEIQLKINGTGVWMGLCIIL